MYIRFGRNIAHLQATLEYKKVRYIRLLKSLKTFCNMPNWSIMKRVNLIGPGAVRNFVILAAKMENYNGPISPICLFNILH